MSSKETAPAPNASMAPAVTPATATDAPVNEYEDSERNYQPRSLKFWAVMSGIYFSIFLVALDRTIIATAIPRITDEFHSIQDIGWYGSAYMLAASCFFPLSGRLFQIYSTKWVYLGSIVLFEAGSALCGAAPNSVALIVGRAIAGMGSAGIMSGGIMVMIPMIPLRKRPIFTATFGMLFGLSSVLGPIVGGAFTDHVTWRWCFYINLPIGGFVLATSFLFFHPESPKHEKLTLLGHIKRLDPIGFAIFVSSITCLILALQWGGTTDPWSAPRIIGLLVTFAVLLIAFIVYEVMTPNTAMIPARIMTNRSMAGTTFFMFFTAGAMMCIVYYIAIWFQAAQGKSATSAGISTLPVVLSMMVFGIVVAKIIERTGYYIPPMIVSPFFSAVGCGLLSTLVPSSDAGHWIGFQMLFGIGLGCGFQTSTLAPQAVLARADVSIGQGLVFLMQQIGGAVFIAVGQNLFTTQIISELSGVAGLDPEMIINMGATNIRNVVPESELATVINAYSYALTRTFVLAAALSATTILGTFVMEWKSIKGVKTAQKDAEAAQETTDTETKKAESDDEKSHKGA